MEQRLSRFGAGPGIFRPTFAYAVLAGVATWLWPGICLLRAIPSRALWIPGLVLLVPGVLLWALSVVCVMRAYNQDRLVTSGIFAVCRHPLYASIIGLALPGAALLSRSWPFLLMPLVAYLGFRRKIRTEDDYLQKRFGEPYLQYRARVNEFLPTLRH